MSEQVYFEQFTGDVPYRQPWRDERIEKILQDAGIIYDGGYQWTGTRCDFVTYQHTNRDILSRLTSVQNKYKLKNVSDFKPDWIIGTGVHGHFEVDLKPQILWELA